MNKAFLTALQFLTILPVTLPKPADEHELGRSLLFYPLVGLILGLILTLLLQLLPVNYPLLSAVLLLIAWVGLTGGLHLDGLADSADAWLGGIGSKHKTLAIMKDPASGPIAVCVLILILLLKLALVSIVVAEQRWELLCWTIILARTALPLLFLSTPYVRVGGLGSQLKSHIPLQQTKLVLIVTTLLAGYWQGLAALVFALIVFLVIRYAMEQRLGGFTGDTAGAMVELMEAALLTFLIIF